MVGAVLTAGVIAASPLLLSSLENRLNEKGGTAFGGRPVLWEASLNLLKDYPFTGAGIANGRFELRRYIAQLTTAYDHRDDLPSHNPFLEVGTDTGIFGMFLYVSVCAAALWQFRRNYGRWRKSEPALAAYFPIVLSTGAGYVESWLKSGGMDAHPTFILLLALLIIPSQISFKSRATSNHGAADAAAHRLTPSSPGDLPSPSRIARTSYELNQP